MVQKRRWGRCVVMRPGLAGARPGPWGPVAKGAIVDKFWSEAGLWITWIGVDKWQKRLIWDF